VGIDLMDGGPPLTLEGLAQGQWRDLTASESRRLSRARP
jgi:23S rRNA pseudouridine2457 synthase